MKENTSVSDEKSSKWAMNPWNKDEIRIKSSLRVHKIPENQRIMIRRGIDQGMIEL